ncbi:uncharacterized protein LOC111630749 [Centruroides sculpturatus]|uniref:uncharacterized protein LOC111630749 n=1 Tax=Centruroides sculpturatus TaxID=218467 RepID=UPI000C6D1A43|nr:uncharacterized protein LOC111630749 [Centruroides sculpturatus]
MDFNMDDLMEYLIILLEILYFFLFNSNDSLLNLLVLLSLGVLNLVMMEDVYTDPEKVEFVRILLFNFFVITFLTISVTMKEIITFYYSDSLRWYDPENVTFVIVQTGLFHIWAHWTDKFVTKFLSDWNFELALTFVKKI